jgi:hypothetical protein
MARFVGARHPVSTGLLPGVPALHAVPPARLHAHVVPPLTPCGPGIGGHVGEALVRPPPRRGRTPTPQTPGSLAPQERLAPGPLGLAAITRVWCRRVVGAREGSRGAILTPRGAPEGVTGRTSSAGAGAPPRWGTATPRHAPQASTRRPGASPRPAGCDVPRAVSHEAPASLGRGASRTRGRGAVAWEAAGGRPAGTRAELPGWAGARAEQSSSVAPAGAARGGSSRPGPPRRHPPRGVPPRATRPRSDVSHPTPRWDGRGDRDPVTWPVPPFVPGTV